MSSPTKKISLIVFVAVLWGATYAQAGTLDLVNKGIAQSEFKDLSRELGIATHYIPASPAEPLGLLPGFDAGIEITAASINTKNAYWNKVAPKTPGVLPIPKLHLQKGLPFGIDLGASYASIPELDLAILGGEIKYALLSGNIALPAVAIRGAFTQLTGISTLDLKTTSLDLSVSKGVAFVTPFAGVGVIRINSKEKAGLNLKPEEQDVSNIFAGVKITLALINIVAEADFSEIPLYTLRLNVGF